MRKFILLLFIVVACYSSYGQSIRGYVVDDSTNEPLIFVHILVNKSRSGTTSDIDGRFRIQTERKVETLTFSYVGYVTQTINLDEYLKNHPNQTSQKLVLRMKADTRVLKELVFEADENPAHPIIRKVVENRKINNPEKIKSFKYKSYNKFYMDAEGIEDDDDEFQDFIATKYLFMMESVTERKYLRPNRSKETVLANRVSGFKNPLFTTLANSFQPFSFYGDYIKVAGKKYLNPISKGTLNKYFFELKDSIYSKNHKVYIIGFEPMKKNFDGLKGLLYVNTFKYAIENVIAETANLAEHFNDNMQVEVNTESEGSQGVAMDVQMDESDSTVSRDDSSNDEFEQISITFKIQQKYDLMGDSLWFPLQLNTDITIGDATGSSSGAVKGVGRSYLSDIELLAEVKSREFDRMALEFDPKANKRDSLFWDKYRIEPMDTRGLETYSYIDSIGEEAHIDRYVTGFAMLTTGKLRTGKIDFDIKEFLKYNKYESVRLGVGAHTNQLFSRFFNVGGYFAYGFGDKEFKYGADVNFFLTKKNEIKLSFLYQSDVVEFAGSKFYLDNNPLSSETNRKFMIDNMDRITNTEIAASFYFLKYLDTRVAFSQSTRNTTSGYAYAPPDVDVPVLVNSFQFTELKLGFKYSFREKYVEVFGNKVSMGTKYPVLWFNYTRGFEGVASGQYYYEKWDVKIQKTFEIRGFGKPSFTIKGGYAVGNTPGSVLFNGNGSKAEYIPLEAANSFQTMRLGEFLSDKYIAVYYTHNLGKIVIHPRKSTPEFLLVTSGAWGELEHPEYHRNISFKTMENGYYESGLAIRDIYRLWGVMGFGVAGYYRYGFYGSDNVSDNLAIKVTLKFSL